MDIGRPTKYLDSYPVQAEKLCRLGATDREMADFFEVSESTINRWKDEHPEFWESIKKGKVQSDAEVADRLYQRALGYEWQEEQAIKLKSVGYEDGRRDSEEERVEIVTVKRAAPPDTTAAIFWLKNRQPNKWRDKTLIGLSDLTDAELIERAYELAAGSDPARSGPAPGGDPEPTPTPEGVA